MPDLTALSRRTGIPVPVLQAIASAGQRHAQRVVLYGSRAPGGSPSRKRYRHRLLWQQRGLFPL